MVEAWLSRYHELFDAVRDLTRTEHRPAEHPEALTRAIDEGSMSRAAVLEAIARAEPEPGPKACISTSPMAATRRASRAGITPRC